MFNKIFFGVLFVTFSMYSQQEATTYLVNVPFAGIYDKPDTTIAYDSQKIYGSPVTIINDHNDDWVKIRTSEGIENYCLKKDLVPDNKQWLTSANAFRVKSLMGCVYPRPAVQGQTIIRLPYGSSVQVVDTQADEYWTKVLLADGTMGWMVKGDLEVPTMLSIEESIQRARMFLGTPYIWGGVTSYGIDCSGLSQLIAIQRGYQSMLRNSSQQFNDQNLTIVPLADVQPGDFIYFERNGRIIHVALCSGPDMMIHAYGARGILQVIETPIQFLADIVKEARRLPAL